MEPMEWCVIRDGGVGVGFFNERRGLHIPGTNFRYHSEGAYGLIFVDAGAGGRARKVYRAKAGTDRAHSEAVFAAEAAAYALAMDSEPARALVPAYFGPCVVPKLLDGDGTDVTSEIYGDLAFEMEFIPGKFLKIVEFGHVEQERVTSILVSAGILYVMDSSATAIDGLIHKVVDFSTREIEVWPDDLF